MGLKIYALLPLYKYLLRIKPWVNTQPQLMGNDKRNEWKRQFSTKAGTPKLCVCGWHMALRFMGWPYPSSKSSFEFSTKEKVSRVRPHRVQSERKDCPHINCGSAKKIQWTQQWKTEDVGGTIHSHNIRVVMEKALSFQRQISGMIRHSQSCRMSPEWAITLTRN